MWYVGYLICLPCERVIWFLKGSQPTGWVLLSRASRWTKTWRNLGQQSAKNNTRQGLGAEERDRTDTHRGDFRQASCLLQIEN